VFILLIFRKGSVYIRGIHNVGIFAPEINTSMRSTKLMKIIKWVLILYFSGLIALIIYREVEVYKWNSQEYLDYDFNGRLERFNNDYKGYPVVQVKGTEYYLLYVWDKRVRLEKGDSLYKRQGIYRLEIYDSKGTLKFRSKENP
jgi:hypothetical protein